jgi:Bacteriophage T4, Gp8
LASVHSKYLDVFVAKQVKESVSEASSSNVYLTFGKSSGWANEAAPPQANTSVASFNEIWKNMVGGKRIVGSNIRHAIPRFNWTANTIYTPYDHLIDSLELKNANTQFYVVTTDYNVYKCLSNNYGTMSTIQPNTTITTTHFQTSDGYIWKYMYTLTAEERLRFLTTSFVPVKTISASDGSIQWDVQAAAVPGAIHVINLTNVGSNYYSNDISVVISGDGKNCNAFALLNTTSHTVQSIVVDDIGSDYTYANVNLISSNGSGASARAVISPQGGHGSDPLTELGGSYLIFNIQLKNTENGVLTIHNDYRQIALIEDPLKYGSSNVSSNSVVSQLTVLTLNGVSVEYSEDEWVYQGESLESYTFRGYVTEWDSSNNIIKLSQTEGTPSKNPLVGANTTAARFVALIGSPDLQPYTGKLLYKDNITAIERAADQTEDYKIVLNF